jgi:voltage-gated sodium channel
VQPTSQASDDNEAPLIVARCKALIAHPAFDVAILGVILFNALVLALETYKDLADQHQRVFDILNNVILGIYAIELLIRLTAFRWRPAAFAKDKWNVFDFIVVTASFVPGLRRASMALRLVRLLRIVRVIRFLPELRIALSALARSLPGVASLAAATVLLIYIYGMLGWAIFSAHDPEHFGNVGQAMLTMFVMLTFSNLADNIAMGEHVGNWTLLFFISYTLIVGFLLFNLFVGIVLNAMGEARSADRAEHETDDLLARLRAARAALEEAERELQRKHRNDQ